MTPARRVVLRRGVAIGVAAALLTSGCRPAARVGDSADTTVQRDAATPATVASLIGPTWTLVELSGQPAPLGGGDRPATLIFESGGEARASGFAGCNRWSSAYTHAAPDRIQFTAPLSTKMACATGMDLEQRFLAMVTATRGYAVSGAELALRGDSVVHARFVAR